MKGFFVDLWRYRHAKFDETGFVLAAELEKPCPDYRRVKRFIGFGAALHRGLYVASCRDDLQAVQLLLGAGADMFCAAGPDVLIPPAWAARSGALRVLEHYLDLDHRVTEHQDYFGNRIPFWAATGGQLESLKLLRQYGADFLSLNDRGENVFTQKFSDPAVMAWLAEYHQELLHEQAENRKPRLCVNNGSSFPHRKRVGCALRLV